MIKHLTHNMIDKRRWDDCIAKSFNGSVYAWSWYLDIVHPEWEALIENDYERVMPLTPSRKFGISYMFQPFFVQQLGVYSQSSLNEEIVETFVDSIPKKYRVVKYRLNEYNKVDYILGVYEPHRNVELDLIYDYQTLKANYNGNTRRNLAKAEAAQLTINKDIKPETIIKLFAENRGKDVSHWKEKEYRRLLDLIDTAIYHESCFVCGVNDIDGQTIAGGVFMYSHDRIIFLFSGCDENQKHKHALTYMLNYIIKEFCESSYVFDFEGSDNEGLARFYKGFGGKEIFYPEVKYNRLGGIFKLAYKIIGK